MRMSPRQQYWDAMTLASPESWLQLFSMRCWWVWDEAFPSLIVCKVPAVNVVALKIIGAACKHDLSQRRHNRVEIPCLYMIILVSSVPMYGGFEGVLWKCCKGQYSHVLSSMAEASKAIPYRLVSSSLLLDGSSGAIRLSIGCLSSLSSSSGIGGPSIGGRGGEATGGTKTAVLNLEEGCPHPK
jgi:hypothetical protein